MKKGRGEELNQSEPSEFHPSPDGSSKSCLALAGLTDTGLLALN
jgi:hypothetical protein